MMIRALLVGLFMTGAAAADPVYGLWKTQEDGGKYGHIEFQACGDKICGYLRQSFADGEAFEAEATGETIVRDMSPTEEAGKYKGGEIWQPSTNLVYRSKMQLNGDVLKISGCFGPICARQTWTRIN